MRIDKLTDILIKDEGMKLRVYHCPEGFLTIGVGRNLESKGITKEEAMYLLINDIDDCIEKIYKYLPWSKDLDSDRQDVLVYMCFQLGIGGLLGFKEFLYQLAMGDYLKAAEEMRNSLWYKQTPKRVERLAKIMEGQ